MYKVSTKDRIMDAALDLFSAEGYDCVGVDKIAATIGIKGPSLYKHFKSKKEIFDALIAKAEGFFDDRLLLKADSFIPDSLDELYQLTMKQVHILLEDTSVVKFRKILIKEQFRSSRIADILTKHIQKDIEAACTSMFIGMINKGIIKSYDPHVLSLEYISPVSLLIMLGDREPHNHQEILNRIIAHIKHFMAVYGV